MKVILRGDWPTSARRCVAAFISKNVFYCPGKGRHMTVLYYPEEDEDFKKIEAWVRDLCRIFQQAQLTIECLEPPEIPDTPANLIKFPRVA